MEQAISNNWKLFEKHKRRKFVNLTPLIDMMFLLTIFFMLTTNFNKYTEVGMNLSSSEVVDGNKDIPKPETSGVDNAMNLVIMPEDRIILEGQEVPMDDFINAIKDRVKDNPRTSFIIQTVEDAKVQDTVKTMERLHQAGASNFVFSEEAP